MEGDLVTPDGMIIPARALTWRFSRGGGPGGQSVNTTDSRVELVVEIAQIDVPEHVVERLRTKLGDQLRIVVTTERSQLRNRGTAERRACAQLDAAARVPRPRRPTKATAASVRRRLEAKRIRSQVKSTRRDGDESEG